MPSLWCFWRRPRCQDVSELKQAYRHVFTSERGQLVLMDLCSCLMQVHRAEKGAAYMADARAFEDGRRSVAIRIVTMLEDE